MKNSFIFLILLSFISCSAQQDVYTYEKALSKEAKNASVAYTISTANPQTHYAEVSLTVNNYKKEYIDFKMPVWAPGSYLVREFSRFVEDVEATNGIEKLAVEKINKNTWRVFTKKALNTTISYKVYCNELSVRTSFVDDSHAYFNGTSVFMYVDALKQKDGVVTINKHPLFTKIATALPFNGSTYSFTNYDYLVDAPIEIGNHKEFEFMAGGTNHKVAMYGYGNYDIEKLKTDMAKVCEEATNVFGANPNKEYTFIIHNLTNGSGGLEHLNSTTLQVNRWTYGPAKYKGFLSLVAHEYFHLWNVKRVRPMALGPFNYEKENYTHLLWVMEGFTSYYENLILYRAGIYTSDDLINKMKSKISYVENAPGGKEQSASQASFDAWIKAYRPHEHSGNTTISYYSKGATLAFMLELEIINNTNGEKTLDDVMKYLYNEYALKKKRGFTDEEFQKAVEKVAGKSLDYFFKNHVFKPETVDYAAYFKYVGLEYATVSNATSPKLSASMRGNKIARLTVGGSAYESGLNVNDEILAIDNIQLSNNLSQLLSRYEIGDKINVLIARDRIIRTIEVELLGGTGNIHLITPMDDANEQQKKNLKTLFK